MTFHGHYVITVNTELCHKVVQSGDEPLPRFTPHSLVTVPIRGNCKSQSAVKPFSVLSSEFYLSTRYLKSIYASGDT